VSEPSVPIRFLTLPDELADYGRAAYVVLPIPYDGSASYNAGSRNGPLAVLAASDHLEYYDEELRGEFHKCGICTLDPLEPDARGPEAMCQRVERVARKVIRDGKTLIGLGGEHTISIGLVRAALKKWPGLSVLQIDAHADLRNEYHSSRYSHACTMRRIVEAGASVVGVGIRSISAEEARFAKRNPQRITHITARQCWESDDWLEVALDSLSDHVYVSVDLDGLDPAVAPGVGTPEPGGLDWYQLCSLLRMVAEEKQIVAADVVEVCPIPGQTITEFAAARIIYKIICYREFAQQRPA